MIIDIYTYIIGYMITDTGWNDKIVVLEKTT